jgi:SAM-dependent methyltransferase
MMGGWKPGRIRVSAVRQHYEELLADVYSWIIGDFEVARRSSSELFAKLGVKARSGDTAIDLGCGPGCQSIPLAECGFRVTAVDFCERLLEELRQRSGELPIFPVRDDILNFAAHAPARPQLIVCMGDTLVHLPRHADVSALLGSIVDRLEPGGLFIASLRDYSRPPLEGTARFIPIRSDEQRIFTCFLEYGGETIDVHDILHVRGDSGWQLRVSCYKKLLLDYHRVAAELADAGLRVTEPFEFDGMMVIEAVKPA